jgi:hypothetical protein
LATLSLRPIDFERYYVVFSKHNPAKKPLFLADAAAKTGRNRNDFSVVRITAEEYRTLAQFLSS